MRGSGRGDTRGRGGGKGGFRAGAVDQLLREVTHQETKTMGTRNDSVYLFVPATKRIGRAGRASGTAHANRAAP